MNNGTISEFIDNIAELITRCVCPGLGIGVFDGGLLFKINIEFES